MGKIGRQPMKEIPFCHLHFHTEYSLLDSTCKVAAAMQTAKELGQQYLAMTDHGVLYGAVEFYKQAYKHGIKPIIGCEVYVARNGMDEKTSQADNMHLVLLAEDNEGYKNLMRLVSKSHLEGFYYKPRLDKKLLRQYSKGLIGLSACLKGEVTEACAEGAVDKAVALAREYSEIFGPDNFFLELQDHGMAEQKAANRYIAEVAKITGLPLVATNDVHYLRQQDHEAHDVLICLQQGNLLSDTNRMSYPGDQFYMKSGAEMQRLFPDQPEALSNTIEIARRCNVEFEFNLPAERLHFPSFPLPEGFTKEEYLVELGKRGLEKLYKLNDFDHPENELGERVKKQFEYEVEIIEKTNYVNYFLVVQDFIRWAKNNGIPVGPGRGSGAGSILAYALGITAIDPLKYNLIFERFLNPDRVSPPDFDIDFCPTRRADVINYVRRKYGEDCVAQIITFGTLGAKTLMRDVGRVLNLPLSDCDRIAKLIPDMTKNLQTAQQESPDFKRACEQDPVAREIMKYAPQLEGLPRHTGMHAAGVVIGEKPLIEIIPLTRERKENMTVVQFEKGPTEDIGLLKMDFLGLKNLTIIQEAIEHVEKNHNVRLDPMELPLDDPLTFDLLCKGNTAGVFQLESPGMRDTLRQVAPDCMEDIIAILALYRPGPMQFIPLYTKRKHGHEKVQYDHPILEPILKETNGIIVYQEQIQQAARDLAGFSLGRGDILRRAMGKKKKEAMDEQRGFFVEGCKKTNNIDARLANTIFDNIAKFAEYGFNKSHSTAYGFISYQTAWLKAHYPAEFMAALLSCEMGNPDKLALVLAETREMGLEVRPPSVNESIARFRPVKGAILFGMAGVKNVGSGAVETLVKEREANGPFTGLIDFCRRVDSREVNRKTLESLIKCGAFDFTGIHRARLFAGIDIAMARAAESARDRSSGQISMFDLLGGVAEQENPGDNELPDAEAWHESEMLSAEKELIGFYISGHPLAQYEWVLNTLALQRVGTLPDVLEAAGGDEKKSLVRVGGLIDKYRKVFTKKDNPRPYARFCLEGLEASVTAVVWPDDFPRFESLLQDGAAVMVGGKLARDFRDELEIQVSEIYPLAQAPILFAEKVGLHLTEAALTGERLQSIKAVAQNYPGPTPLILCILMDTGEKVFIKADRNSQVKACPELVQAFEKLLGEDSVYVGARAQPLLQEPSRRRFNGRKR
jgi:DNA polymerase-3 subunit alpha